MSARHHNQKPFGERLINSKWRWILFPFWLLYRPIIGIRNFAYDAKILRSKRLPKPVISIGNIIAGGSGKTPFVAHLVALLKQEYKIHVLSRGYKGDGDANEEAALIQAPVHCNSNRHAAGQQAVKDGADVMLLDDGFQHRQLARQLDIVLIDATRPWGFHNQLRGAVLPLGFLRESRRSLQRADVIILSRCNQAHTSILEYLRKHMPRICDAVFECSHQATAITHNKKQLPLDALKDKAVLAVSGIAHPQAFIDTISEQQYQIIARHDFADHHHYTATDVDRLITEAKQTNAVVLCTSKDAVKLQPLWPSEPAVPLYVLEVGLHFPEDHEQRLTQAIRARLSSLP